MVKRYKIWVGPRCYLGKPIRHIKGSSYELEYCEVCGFGPMHTPTGLGMNSTCGCSFVRASILMCRECTYIYDLGTQGNSRLRGSFDVTYQAVFIMGMFIAKKNSQIKR